MPCYKCLYVKLLNLGLKRLSKNKKGYIFVQRKLRHQYLGVLQKKKKEIK